MVPQKNQQNKIIEMVLGLFVSCDAKAQNWDTDTILNGFVSIKCHAEPNSFNIG